METHGMAAWVDEYVRGGRAWPHTLPRTHARTPRRSAGSTVVYRGTNTPSPMTEIAENRLVGRARAGPRPSLMATACCGAAAGSAPPDSGVRSPVARWLRAGARRCRWWSPGATRRSGAATRTRAGVSPLPRLDVEQRLGRGSLGPGRLWQRQRLAASAILHVL